MAGADFKEIESKMHKCVEAARGDFASIRTGRASPALLDRLVVEAYGQATPLKQVAGVSIPDSRTLHDHGMGQRRRFGDSKGN